MNIGNTLLHICRLYRKLIFGINLKALLIGLNRIFNICIRILILKCNNSVCRTEVAAYRSILEGVAILSIHSQALIVCFYGYFTIFDLVFDLRQGNMGNSQVIASKRILNRVIIQSPYLKRILIGLNCIFTVLCLIFSFTKQQVAVTNLVAYICKLDRIIFLIIHLEAFIQVVYGLINKLCVLLGRTKLGKRSAA